MGAPNLNEAVAKRVFWGIDPFHESPKEQLQAAKTILHLFFGYPIHVQPVSVLFPGRYDPSAGTFFETWSELATQAEKNIASLFKDLKLPGLQKPHLIRQKTGSVSSCVDSFLSFALAEGADYIVVSSHARTGVSRLLLGSFAESLVLRSPLPVLVVNPKSDPTTKLKNILFPTDFSDKSREAFQSIVLLAKKVRCKILLFHKMQYLYPEFGYPFVVPPVSRESLKAYVETHKREAALWSEEARQQGVSVKCHISSRAGYALEEIIHAAKKLGASGMIAMTSQSGAMASLFLGSLTRQVLRSAPCPVLVIHPHPESGIQQTIERIKARTIEFGTHPLMT